MVKVNFDSTTGEIIGFYPEDINYKDIPEPFLEVDSATHIDCINNQGKRVVDLVSLKIVEYSPLTTLPMVKVAKCLTIASKLLELDKYISRGLEDTWTLLQIDISKLPEIQQERLSKKVSLRKLYSQVENASTLKEVEEIVIPD